MTSTLSKLALFLAFLGASICLYLIYISLSGAEIVCGLSTCGIVNGSEYAYFLGIPVSFFGLAFYLTCGALILLKQTRLFLIVTTIGLIFSAYLTFLEAFVIRAWCQWCVLSAWISLSLFIIAIKSKKENVSVGTKTEIANGANDYIR